MKTVFSIIALCFVLIASCMIYLIKSGTSIRSEALIRPSPMTTNHDDIARAVVVRLTPQFQNSDFIILDFDGPPGGTGQLARAIQADYQNYFKKTVNVIGQAETENPETIRDCAAPCWLIVSKNKAHQLAPNEFIDKTIKPLGRPYITLTWIPFDRTVQIPPGCEEEKRLSFDCLKPLAVHEANRKMRKPDVRYFFMRKYLDQDFFLFTERD